MAQWCCTYVSNTLPIFRPCPLLCVPNQIPQHIEVVMGILRLWVIGVWAVTSSRRARGGVWAGTGAYVSQYFAHHRCILPWTHNRALCVFRDPSGYLFLLKYQIDMIVLVWGGKSKQSITFQWSLDSQSSTFFIIASTKRAVYSGCSAYLYVNTSLLAAKVDRALMWNWFRFPSKSSFAPWYMFNTRAVCTVWVLTLARPKSPLVSTGVVDETSTAEKSHLWKSRKGSDIGNFSMICWWMSCCLPS